MKVMTKQGNGVEDSCKEGGAYSAANESHPDFVPTNFVVN